MDPGSAVEVPDTPLVPGVRSGSLAFLIAAGVAQLCAWITALGLPGEPLSIVHNVKLGAIYLVGFLGAMQSWSVTDPIAASAQIAVPLLAGTILIVWLGARCRGGIAVATLTFGLLCAALAVVVAAAPLVLVDGGVRVTPVWWAVLARACVLFGIPAALASLGRRFPAARRAIGGGWRMVAGTVLATAVLMIVLLPMQHAISDRAFIGFRRLGEAGGAAAWLNNALVYPSEAATVATIALGGCAGISGQIHVHEVCGIREVMPGGAEEDPWTPGATSYLDLELPSIPTGYAWFVVGPVLGIGGGGWWVGRMSRKASVAQTVGRGSAAGGVAAVLFTGVAYLSSVRIARFDIASANGGGWRLGAFATSLVLPSVVWCVPLGAVGALAGRAATRTLAVRRSVAQHESASRAEESAERGEGDPDRGTGA